MTESNSQPKNALQDVPQNILDRLNQLEQENRDLKNQLLQKDIMLQKNLDIFNKAPIHFLRVDCSGKIYRVNIQAAKLLGKETHELLGADFHDFVASDSSATFRSFLDKIFRDKENSTCEIQLKTADQSQSVFLIHAHIAPEEDSCFISIVNITKGKKDSKTLIASFQNYIELSKDLPVGIFETDDKGYITYVNQKTLDWFGYTETDINDRLHFSQFFPAEERQRVVNRFRLSKSSKKPITNDYYVKKKDQSIFPVRISSAAMFKENNTIGVGGIIIDLTEQKKVQSIINEQNVKFRTFFQTTRQGIIYLDSKSKIVMSNPSAERIMDMMPEEMKNFDPLSPEWKVFREDGSIFPKKELPHFQALQTGKNHQAILGFYNADKSRIIWVNSYAEPLSYNGEEKPQQVYVSFEDITELKESESNLQRINKRITALREIDHAISFAGTENITVNKLVIEKISEMIPCDNICILRIDQDTDEAVIEAKKTGKTIDFLIPSKVSSKSLELEYYSEGKTKHKILNRNNVSSKAEEELLNQGNEEIVIVPLIANNKLVGLFSLSNRKAGFFTSKDIDIAEEIAIQLSINIFQHSLNWELQQSNILLEHKIRQRTNQIREISKLQQAILDNTGTAIIGITPKGIIHTFNPAAERLTGYKAEEVLWIQTPVIFNNMEKVRRDKTDNISYEGMTDMQVLIAKTLKNPGEAVEREYLRKDGSQIDVLLNTTILYNEQGDITGYVGFALDNTERKKAEANLRMQSAAFEAFAESIIITDKDGLIQWTNPAFSRLTGYTAEEAFGKKPSILKSGKHPHTFYKDLWDTILSGNVCQKQIINKRKDGSFIHSECTITPVCNAFGNITNFIAMQVDITYQKEIEQALQKSEERWQFALDGSDLGVWDWDMQSKEHYYSPRWKIMLGYEIDEISNSHNEWLSRVHPADLPECMNEINSYLSGAIDSFDHEHRLRCKDGSYKWMRVRGKIVTRSADNQPLRIIGTHSDITRKKLAETKLLEALNKEKELNDMKSRFVSTSSHEFRTPLSSILLTTESLISYRSKMNDEQMEHRLIRIKDQAMHLSSIVENILQLSKLQDGKLSCNLEPVELISFSRNLINVFNDDEKLHQSITFNTTDEEISINADKRLLRQIFNNLISNAIKYSPENTKIEVDIKKIDKSVFIIVSDNGIGISREDQKHLFSPFFRASNASNISGNGLGLSIVKESVLLHKGKISVSSNLAQGTTFTIVLPTID